MNVSEKRVKGWFIMFRFKQQIKCFLRTLTEGEQEILIASYQANRYLSDVENTRLAKLLQTRKSVIKQWLSKARKEE